MKTAGSPAPETQPSPSTVVWTVLAFLVSAAPHLAAMPAALLAATLVGPAWRLAALWRGWGPPRFYFRLPLTLGGVSLVFLSYGSLWGRRAAASLLCVMLAAKMLELFRLRDLRMVASVAFFLVATQFLFSERLIYLGYLGIACWLATLALLKIQQDAQRPPQSGKVTERQPLFDAGTTLAMALPFAIALFMLFPRLDQPLWGLPDNVMDARTGLSDTMRPGSIAELYADESPAFRVEFEGDVPPAGERYWRGPVLWNYDGDTWRQFSFSEMTEPPRPDAGPARYRYEVQLEPNEQRWLFTLDYPAQWSEDADLTGDYQLVRNSPVTSALRYEVVSEPEFLDNPEELSAQFRQAALQLPDDRNPRTIEQAEAWREEFPDDRDLIDHVMGWFNTEEFYYSLDPGPLGRDAMDDFLFDLRDGFCEYYASGFATLMRAADIPARVVTGYQGGLWQDTGEYLLVRQSDAHAWVELWHEGQGWQRVDPTAWVSPDRIDLGLGGAVPEGDNPPALSRRTPSWGRTLALQWDALNAYWDRWVLAYGPDMQRRLMDRLGLGDWQRMILVLTGLMLLSLALLAVLILWRRPARPPDPVQQDWLRFCKRMADAGLPRGVSEGPRDYADRLIRERPDLAAQIDAIARLYVHLRYTERGSTQQAQALRTQIARFRPRTQRTQT